MINWVILVIAGLFEVCWAMGLKTATTVTGTERILAWGFTAVTMFLSVALLFIPLKHLPVGTAYAVWTGIGAAGAVAAGIIIFKEPLTFARVFCVLLIVSGIIGLKLISEH